MRAWFYYVIPSNITAGGNGTGSVGDGLQPHWVEQR